MARPFPTQPEDSPSALARSHRLGRHQSLIHGALVMQGVAPCTLTQAMEGGYCLLIDEINLAPPGILSVLGPLLDGSTSLISPQSGATIRAAPGFRILATCNSARYAGRQALPMSLRGRFQV